MFTFNWYQDAFHCHICFMWYLNWVYILWFVIHPFPSFFVSHKKGEKNFFMFCFCLFLPLIFFFWQKEGEKFAFVFFTPLLMIDKKGEKNLSFVFIYAYSCYACFMFLLKRLTGSRCKSFYCLCISMHGSCFIFIA